MQQFEYQVRFNTPGFLGNAEQIGQWRTPPFKALLRQWWRVAFAAGRHGAVDVDEMRRQEGVLFGVAADGREGSRKSQLRIRLAHWGIGAETRTVWGNQELALGAKIQHPEVKPLIGPLLYLGYGPLEVSKIPQPGKPFPGFATTLKKNAAIQRGEENILNLAFPDDQAKEIQTALWLIHHYGTLGGRSRNGWGSISLTPANDQTPVLTGALAPSLIHDWRAALQLDWPHAIGRDQQALIWRTPAFDDWKTLMRRLAEIKIGLRTQFKFTTGFNASHPEARHWLSYPVTKHNVEGWREPGKGDYRLPNSLRFKVRQAADGKLQGVIVHVPCAPPAQFRPRLSVIEQVWRTVHQFLDNEPTLSRIPA